MMLAVHRQSPLTLTLSPLAGRGDAAHAVSDAWGTGAAYPFSPLAGRRWRQPDEGPLFVSRRPEGGNTAPLNKNSQEG